MLDSFGRRSCVLVVLLAISMVAAACTDSSSRGRDSTVRGPSENGVSDPEVPTEFIRLGLTIDDSDRIHVLIPECSNAEVIAVGWLAPSELYTIWSAARSRTGVDVDEVVLGVVPDGFEMGTSLENEVLPRWRHRETLVIVGWNGRNGSDGLAGAAAVEPSELEMGSVLYGAGSTGEIRYESRAEYKRSADCEFYASV